MEKTEVQNQVHLDAATALLTGNLQEGAERSGLDNTLQRWIQDIKDANNPEFHQVVVDLQELKAHMGSGTYDKDIIGRLLNRLGENTVKAAVFAEGNTKPRVEQLGEALLAAAKQVQHPGTANSAEHDLQNS
ncbi:hypothetical protein [Hymenobacter persicinus]|uniref:Uncharacterized protein n=1 Tax=Hymenobacter persicinus TaxID=2025506 RepID=A0A4V1ZAS7_9BACT|nr:hypothetical protein [Hymenobacter persicinus]RYU79739.1 hypothetical protein EWM57_10030 [Hymenobacter persicinus]